MKDNETIGEIVAPGITATYIDSGGFRFPMGVSFNLSEMSEGAVFTVYKKNGQMRLEAGSMVTDWKENQTSLS